MKKKELPRKRLRRQADIKLAESHQFLDIILSHTNMLVAYLDPRFNFIKVNQAYARSNEKEPAFFVGKNYFQFYPHAEDEAIFKKVVKTGKPYSARAKPFDYAEHPERGLSYRDWSLIPLKNNKNQVNGLVLTLIDVTRNTTAHMQAEERLRESEEKYMNMVEYSNDMIWTLDKKGNFTYINKKSEEITGYKIKEVRSKGFVPILLEEDLEMVFDVFRKTLKGNPQHYEVRIHDASRKKQITLSVNTAPIYKDKKIIGTVSFGRDITKRKKMEKMLRESEVYYRSVVEDQTELISRYQPDCTLTFVNEAYCRYFDKKYGDLIGYNWLSFLPEEEREMVLQQLTTLSPENPVVTHEHRVIFPTGDILWQEWIRRAIFDDQGHLVEFQSVGRDITKRKKMEEMMRESEIHYRSVVEDQTELICRFQPDCTLTFVNESYCRYFDKKREDLVGYNWLSFLPEEEREMAFQHLNSLSPENPVETYEHRVISSTGDILWQEWTDRAIFDEKGHLMEFQSVGRDITKRKKMEELLLKTRQHLQRAQAVAKVGSWDLDLIENQLNWSDEAYRIFGIAPVTPLTYEIFLDTVHPYDREYVDVCWQTALKGEPYDIQHRIMVDGEVKWVEEKAKLKFDNQGKPISAVGTVQDISERKEHEENIRQLRDQLTHTCRVSTLGELNAAMAHEINQPLTAIMSNTQAGLRFLKAGQPDMEEIKEIFKDILSDNRRASEVIRKLKKMVIKQSEDRIPVDINEIIQEVVTLLHSDILIRNVDLKLKLKTEIPRIKADRIQIQQVILNLALNCFDALKNQTRGKRKIRIGNRVDNKNGLIEIYVSDSGPGLESDGLEDIFLPFFSSKSQGMGMGLAINRTIIEAHEGTIRAHNNPEGGFTVSFTLPIPEEG